MTLPTSSPPGCPAWPQQRNPYSDPAAKCWGRLRRWLGSPSSVQPQSRSTSGDNQEVEQCLSYTLYWGRLLSKATIHLIWLKEQVWLFSYYFVVKVVIIVEKIGKNILLLSALLNFSRLDRWQNKYKPFLVIIVIRHLIQSRKMNWKSFRGEDIMTNN